MVFSKSLPKISYLLRRVIDHIKEKKAKITYLEQNKRDWERIILFIELQFYPYLLFKLAYVIL